MRFALIVAAVLPIAAQALPPIKAKPGDTVTMPIIVRNVADSNNSIDEVRITTSVTSSAIVTESDDPQASSPTRTFLEQ